MSVLALILLRSNSFPWFWLVLGACAGVYLFIHGFILLQRKRLIMNTPASKVRSAAMGLVEISGLAAGPFTLTAPITGKPSFYYRTMAWQWRREGKNSKWVKVADESYHVPFFLEDNTGHVLVDPQGAEMEIHRDFQDEFSQSLFSASLPMPQNVAGFLMRHGVSTDCKIKVEEYCIKPKNALFVLGTLATNPGVTVSAVPVRSVLGHQHTTSLSMPTIGGGLSLRSRLSLGNSADDLQPPSLTASSVPKHPLDSAEQAKIAAALTKAGIVNPMAWAAAGIGPGTQATAQPTANSFAAAAAPATDFDVKPATALMKGQHNPAFFISWRSQRDIVKSLGWKSALMIWGGPLLTLFCVYTLAAHYGWL